MSDTLSCAQSGPADASTRDRILALLREAASGTGEGCADAVFSLMRFRAGGTGCLRKAGTFLRRP